MELKQKSIILIFLFLYGCTFNPFWEDRPTKKLTISGTVIAEYRVTGVPVYVWVEDLDISGRTNSDSEFSIDISGLETGDGSFSGEVRVFYYIHNYKVQHSILSITEGRFSSSQTDFDEDGMLIEPIILEKLASFSVSCDDNWDRSTADSMRVKMEISIKDHDVSILSNVKSIDHDYVPSGVIFYTATEEEIYFDQNNIDYLNRYDLDSGFSITWTYWLGSEDITASAGSYSIRPWFLIVQDKIPDALFQSLGINDMETISIHYLSLPIDIAEKSISLQ